MSLAAALQVSPARAFVSGELWLAFGATWLASLLLARAAVRLGWVDLVGASERARKDATLRTPLVGGAAILFGLVVAAVAGALALPQAATLALGAAFALGLVDDRRAGGLAPRPKLYGQALVAVLVATAVVGGLPASWPEAGTFALAASLALALQNVVNTWDHADGLATGVVAVSLAASGAPIVAAAVAGFLPANLGLKGRGPVARPILGDSGSHLLAVLLLLAPRARAMDAGLLAATSGLLLPTLDLARVVLERRRAGVPIWRGDRRHLAHRLARAGLGRRTMDGRGIAAAAPAAVAFTPAPQGALPATILCSATLLAFGALVAFSSKSPHAVRRDEPY